jgi:hypothetical protein
MLRHACGFALAAKGRDTRALQAYLDHRNIQHTVRYTELSATGSNAFGAVTACYGTERTSTPVTNLGYRGLSGNAANTWATIQNWR